MRVTRETIVLEKFFVETSDPSCGAVCSFVGLVRNHDHGRVVRRLHYECYASMAEKMMDRVILEAKEIWPVHEIRVLHRVGVLEIGEAAVAIQVSAAHRDEAFRACRFVIDEIKNRVPIWKKEIFADGTEEWATPPPVCIDSKNRPADAGQSHHPEVVGQTGGGAMCAHSRG